MGQTIMCLGQGSNGHEVALLARQKNIGIDPNANLEHHNSHRDILTSMNGHPNNFGIIAVRNSLGRDEDEMINLWLPCLLNGGNQPRFSVIGEITMPIKQNLLVRDDISNINELDGVISHPNALHQCSSFLDEHNISLRIPSDSTAQGAEFVADNSSYSRYGAIGTKLAAQIYGLKVLQHDIATKLKYGSNRTRFLIVGKKQLPSSDNSRTAILFSVPDKKNSLVPVLLAISVHNVNMSELVTIKLQGSIRKCVFFVEMEGHVDDDAIKAVLHGIQCHTSGKFVILGSYPVFEEQES